MTIVNYLTGLAWMLLVLSVTLLRAVFIRPDDKDSLQWLIVGMAAAIPSAAWLIARYLL